MPSFVAQRRGFLYAVPVISETQERHDREQSKGAYRLGVWKAVTTLRILCTVISNLQLLETIFANEAWIRLPKVMCTSHS